MTIEPVTYLRASAGSGKTFRLSSQILRILFCHPEQNPSEILATTFTRAAAAEILDRVLKRLSSAVLDAASRQELGMSVGIPDLDEATCARTLERLAEFLHRIGVGTIDAFFARIGRAMPERLGLPNTWRVSGEAEADGLSESVVFQLLKDHPDPIREAWKRWTCHVRARVSGPALVELFDKIRSQRLRDPGRVQYHLNEMPRIGSMAAEIRAAAKAIEVPRTKAGRENVRWSDHLQRLREIDGAPPLIEWFDGHSIFAKIRGGATEFASVEIMQEMYDLYDFLEKQVRALARLVYEDQCLALWRLQRLYSPARDSAARRAGSVTFAEVEAFVRQAATGSSDFDWDDLYFVLDGRVQHVLFDEFQDTSASQFEFFEPIFDEAAASEGRSVFVVGDPKQAIYGWRGGDRDVIDAFPKRFDVVPEAMNDSWRSSPLVLSTVDKVFQNLSECPVARTDTHFAQAVELWLGDPESPGGYQPHVARRKSLRGEVVVRSFAEDALTDAVLDQVEVLRALPMPPREIGVLVRTKKWIPGIVETLRTRGGISDAVAGSESGTLDDSMAVQWILASLTFLDHPHRNSAAGFLASNAPWARELSDPNDTDACDRWVCTHRDNWMRGGAFGVVDAWLKTEGFEGAIPDRDRARCEELRTLAVAFDADGGGRACEFVKRARTSRSTSMFKGSVRVMTIHASKGLEFDAVIVAEIDGGRLGLGPVQFTRDDAGHDCFVPAKDSFAHWAGVAELRSKAIVRKQMEELSLLYVAMTRARSFLHLLVPEKVRSSPGSSCPLSRTLVHTLCAGDPDGEILHRTAFDGEPWIESRDDLVPDGDPAFAIAAEGVSRRSTVARVPRLEPQSPSGREGGGRVKIHEMLENSGGGMEIGTRVHEVLSHVEWSETFDAGHEAIATIRGSGVPGIDAEAGDEIIKALVSRLENPSDELYLALSRNAYAANWEVPVDALEVWRERPFSVPVGQTLVSGRFDRVVVARRPSGDVSRIEVVDFKSDRIRDLEQQREKERYYAPQLESYAAVLREAFRGQPVSPKIGTRLVFTNPR